jgi:hypothetical protein
MTRRRRRRAKPIPHTAWPTDRDTVLITSTSKPDWMGRQTWTALWWDELGGHRGQVVCGTADTIRPAFKTRTAEFVDCH